MKSGATIILVGSTGLLGQEIERELKDFGFNTIGLARKEADLNIIVIDNSSKLISKKIKELINKDSIVLLNKIDLKDNQNHKFDADTILVSVKKK